jgi:predicted ATPase/DNA-binding SARP family transcriptional activator/class 3 adenylate cyclase
VEAKMRHGAYRPTVGTETRVKTNRTSDEEKHRETPNPYSEALGGEAMAATSPEGARPSLSIRLFGPFEVHLHGGPLPHLRSRKVEWLFALLVLRHSPAGVDRAWLAETLWPDSNDPRANLRTSLDNLRRALGPAAGRLLAPTPRTLSIDLIDAEVDLLTFDQAIARGDAVSLEVAVALYRGELLEGCYDEWVYPERAEREQTYLSALETLATGALAVGDAKAAERHLRRIIAVDPLRESAWQILMRALAASGSYAAALRAYRELRERLRREISAEPGPVTRSLFEQIRGEARLRAQGPPAAPIVTAWPLAPLEEGSDLEPSLASQESNSTAFAELSATVTEEESGSALPLGMQPSPCFSLPTGTVTFLLTDIEGSTQLWQQHRTLMSAVIARHDALVTETIHEHGGTILKSRGEGDSFFAVFARATGAGAAACALQRALLAEPWPADIPLRVRVAVHTGEAELRAGDYYGIAVNRCARLRAIAHGGQTLLSQATCEIACEGLPEGVSLQDLGAHRLKDLQRPEQVFQLLHPDLPPTFPPLRSLDAFPNNLPRQLTSFIGREPEIAEIKGRLAPAPLLSLTGPGGCGKTRLALQVAADLVEEYQDGAWLVELAPLLEPELVPEAVATALGVQEEPGRPLLAALADYLKLRQLLLVLDNCEHLVGACAALAEALLRASPGLQILATSREVLGVGGERSYRVPSLSLPEPQVAQATEQLTQYDGVRLFVERAVDSQPEFEVTRRNAGAVVEVCRRLDGIPLALELAAARVKVLSVEQIATRLYDRFRLLTGGSRTALPRQQTLRATIDWSFELLSMSERSLLRRVSVFAGRWTLEAAEAVCSGEGIEEYEVLDLLSQLVDKSLVLAAEQGGEARYRVLETIREYGEEKLRGTGEEADLRGRHRDWYLTLAEQAAPELRGPQQVAWLDRLEQDHDNLRAALQWTLLQGEAGTAVRLGDALGWLWHVRHLGEGRRWQEEVLAASRHVRTPARASILCRAGEAVMREGDLLRAKTLLEEGLALYREVYPRGIALPLGLLGHLSISQADYERARDLYEETLALERASGKKIEHITLFNLGNAVRCLGEYSRAQALFEESVALCRERQDKRTLGFALIGLGSVAWIQGDLRTALKYFQESLALFRQVEDRAMIAAALAQLGEVSWCEGNHMHAGEFYRQSLEIFRELGEKLYVPSVLHGLGELARKQGNEVEAATRFQESLSLARDLGNKESIVLGLAAFAGIISLKGDAERAAQLLGAADALCDRLGAFRDQVQRYDYPRPDSLLHERLGEERFAAAWAEGRAMPLEEAMRVALKEREVPRPGQEGS